MAGVPEMSVEGEKRNPRDRPLRRHRRHFLGRTLAARPEGMMQTSGSLMKMKRQAVHEMHPMVIFAESERQTQGYCPSRRA